MSFETFRHELEQLHQQFSAGFHEYQRPDYSEAKLRDDFLNPFFEALGWDMRNKARLIQSKREVEVESITRIGSGKKRADYLFRVDGRERFVCEAKKDDKGHTNTGHQEFTMIRCESSSCFPRPRRARACASPTSRS